LPPHRRPARCRRIAKVVLAAPRIWRARDACLGPYTETAKTPANHPGLRATRSIGGCRTWLSGRQGSTTAIPVAVISLLYY